MIEFVFYSWLLRLLYTFCACLYHCGNENSYTQLNLQSADCPIKATVPLKMSLVKLNLCLR